VRRSSLVILRGLILAVVLGVAAVGEATAQLELLDEATLLIRRGQEVIGREDYSITRGSDRFIITSVTYYPPRHTKVVLQLTMEVRADSLADLITYRASNGEDERVAAQFNPSRLTIRVASARGEKVREHPIAPRYVAIDDSIYALHLVPPGMESGAIRAYNPREGTRNEGTLVNLGLGTAIVLGDSVAATRVELTVNGNTRRLWYDASGRLVRIDALDTGLTVERVPRGYRP
jgi:YD repeat-containing protein